jgi:hypothetical protein
MAQGGVGHCRASRFSRRCQHRVYWPNGYMTNVRKPVGPARAKPTPARAWEIRIRLAHHPRVRHRLRDHRQSHRGRRRSHHGHRQIRHGQTRRHRQKHGHVPSQSNHPPAVRNGSRRPGRANGPHDRARRLRRHRNQGHHRSRSRTRMARSHHIHRPTPTRPIPYNRRRRRHTLTVPKLPCRRRPNAPASSLGSSVASFSRLRYRRPRHHRFCESGWFDRADPFHVPAAYTHAPNGH